MKFGSGIHIPGILRDHSLHFFQHFVLFHVDIDLHQSRGILKFENLFHFKAYHIV